MEVNLDYQSLYKPYIYSSEELETTIEYHKKQVTGDGKIFS
jgi:hypothetical protein